MSGRVDFPRIRVPLDVAFLVGVIKPQTTGKIKGILLFISFHFSLAAWEGEWERREMERGEQKGLFLNLSRGNRIAQTSRPAKAPFGLRPGHEAPAWFWRGAGRGLLLRGRLCRRRRGVVGVSALSSLRCWRPLESNIS